MCCHRGMGGGGGGRSIQRQARRMTAMPSIVMPKDLCRASRASFSSPRGKSSAIVPIVTWTVSSATTTQ